MDGDEAYALFKAGLKDKDRMIVLETGTKLSVVAKAMGPKKALAELIPYMRELTLAAKETGGLEDEVLCKLAETMNAKFLPLVGGAPAAVFPMIRVLLPLAQATETSVRKRSVVSLASLIAAVPAAGVTDEKTGTLSKEFKEILVELKGPTEKGDDEDAPVPKADEAWFPSKLSGCTLYPAVYATLPKDGMDEEKAAILEHFAALPDDEMPMVRATAADALAGLSKSVTPAVFKQHLLPMFELLSSDRSDVVRESGVKSLTSYLGTLAAVKVSDGDLRKLKEASALESDTSTELSEVVTKMTGLFLKLCNDASWRVRLAIAKTIHDALKPADAKTKGEMLAAFADLLEDEEGDVKLAATKNTANVFAAATSKEMFDTLVLPTVEDGFTQMLDAAKAAAEGSPDAGKSDDLRQAKATSAMELAHYDAIPHKTLVKVVQHMFEDPALCIKMLEKFKLLAKLKESDPGALSQICMDSLQLGVHDDWRVRCAFTAKLAFIFEQIISVESSVAAAASKEAAGGAAGGGATGGAAAAADTGSLATPKKPESARLSTPSTPLDKETVVKAWGAFKSVVDGALWDEVAEARVHFVQCLPKLITWADKIGGDVYVGELLAMLLDQYKCVPGVANPKHPHRKMSYLYKLSVLSGIGAVLSMQPAPPYFSVASNVSELLDLVLAAAKDPTPNVRLVAGKAIGAYAVACCGGYGASPGALQAVETSLIPTLTAMSADSDSDVKTVAQTALVATTEALNSAN